jgi:hypothetical protein
MAANSPFTAGKTWLRKTLTRLALASLLFKISEEATPSEAKAEEEERQSSDTMAEEEREDEEEEQEEEAKRISDIKCESGVSKAKFVWKNFRMHWMLC